MAYSDSPDAHPGLARDQTLAHLISHERMGLVEHQSNEWILKGDE